MDPLGIFITVTVIYILLCLLVSFFIDADATTFLYGKFGPSLSKQLTGKVIWIIGRAEYFAKRLTISIFRSSSFHFKLFIPDLRRWAGAGSCHRGVRGLQGGEARTELEDEIGPRESEDRVP